MSNNSSSPSKRKPTTFSSSSGNPLLQLQKHPLIQTVRVHYEKARVEFQHNPKLRHDLQLGGFALLLGVILGGLLAKTSDAPMDAGSFINSHAPGWNPIHVYYGQENHVLSDIPENWYVKNQPANSKPGVSKEWFGQHGQDIAVAKFLGLKSKGYFVDLAANDAVWASNTFALEHNFDWKGICIEANPVYWYRLAHRPNCHVVGTVVGAKDLEEVYVTLPADAKAQGPFGGIVGEGFDNKQRKKDAEPRYTVTLMHILKKFNAPKVIDYLSLDVEGAEEFIMKDFPLNKPYHFKVITIERPKKALKKKLEEAGYKHVMDFKRGDTMWAHSSAYEAGKKRIENLDEAMKTHILDDWPPATSKQLR